MSSPENIDPIDRSTESPDEILAPKKTRYGRIIVKKGNLPGEDQIPKERKKKGKREEPIRVKRKYTKRKEIVNENKDNEVDAAKEIKKTKELKKKIEVRKEVKEEEIERYESDIEEYNERPVRIYRNGTLVTLPPSDATRTMTYNGVNMQNEDRQSCNLCGELMEEYKMERHLMEAHPEHAPYECLSCRIRFFFDYWELKEHYKVCSNNRIGCDGGTEAPRYRDVIEAAFFRKLYQPVECPFCRIYLGTFFDLDVHFNAHGLCTMDAKFACTGCRVTFTSVDALKRHLTHKNTPHQSHVCFNTGRSLNRREIEKLKDRFEEADRRDCMRKYNNDAYVLAPPKILECVHESICAYCDMPTKAYAHLKRDLSNLVNYGLECSKETEREIIEKIQHSKAEGNGRVSLCRHHFQWRNWTTKADKAEKIETRADQRVELAQNVIRRKREEENMNGMSVSSDARGIQIMDDHCYYGYNQNQPQTSKDDEMIIKKEVKEEVDDWGQTNSGERSYGDEGEDYDVIDISDDEDTHGEQVSLPLFMDKDELEEKMSANLKIAYTCPVCENSYPTLLDLHNHQSAHPQSRLIYSCADCPKKTFSCPDDINKHFDEKMKSAVAAFYSFKVIVLPENSSDNQI